MNQENLKYRLKYRLCVERERGGGGGERERERENS